MFEIGDMVVYGEMGVCEILDVAEKELSGKGIKKFYIMNPVYENGRVYVPVDNPNIMIRPVISRQEAEDLIDMIPHVQTEEYDDSSIHKLTNYYKDIIHCQDCEKLIRLIRSIYSRNAYGEGRKLGQTDRKYVARAESLLYGELAVVLGISKEQVPVYIAERTGMEK